MIDIEKVRERLKSKYTGYGNDEMLLCYTEEQRNIVEEALTELERLQKKEVAMKQKVKKFLKLTSKPSWLLLCTESSHYDCLLKELKDWSDEK